MFYRLSVASRVDAARYAGALEPMEPNAPWRKAILALRARAYEETGHPLAALARRELEEFDRRELSSRASDPSVRETR